MITLTVAGLAHQIIALVIDDQIKLAPFRSAVGSSRCSRPFSTRARNAVISLRYGFDRGIGKPTADGRVLCDADGTN